MELTDRGRNILRAIIQSYIDTAEPVGSRTITKRFDLGISPATVRNIMADLEDMGLLEQPHTSAGRVPTERAFRFYVDTLLEIKGLARSFEQKILNYPLPTDDVTGLMRKTTKLLSELSHFAGVVKSPRPTETLYRQIEFIRLSGDRALAIFVSENGLVHNRMFRLPEGIGTSELARANEIIQRELKGRTLGQLRRHIQAMMKEDRNRYSKLVADLMSCCDETHAEDEPGPADEGELYVGGLTGFFGMPDFQDAERMRDLFEAFEEKHKLIRLLDLAAEADGVQVFIGAENPYFDLEGISLVTASYKAGGNVVGTLGVLGPTRMPYSTVIPIVDCTAKVLGKLLSGR